MGVTIYKEVGDLGRGGPRTRSAIADLGMMTEARRHGAFSWTVSWLIFEHIKDPTETCLIGIHDFM